MDVDDLRGVACVSYETCIELFSRLNDEFKKNKYIDDVIGFRCCKRRPERRLNLLRIEFRG